MMIKPNLSSLPQAGKKLGLLVDVKPPVVGITEVVLSPDPCDNRWEGWEMGEFEFSFYVGNHGEIYGDNLHLLCFDVLFPDKKFYNSAYFNLNTGGFWDVSKDFPLGELGKGYGVCDDVDQVLAKYKKVIENPTLEVALEMTPIFKSAQPAEGGWRWHKNGMYIGTKRPNHEYLYDEEDIDLVFCYHLHMVR